MIHFTGFSHINIVVDNIEEASRFYQGIFNAIPIQEFPRFKNIGFAKSAGFLHDPKPQDVEVTIRFLKIPGAEVMLELMEYHNPRKITKIEPKKTYEFGGPRHISFRVNNIDEAFEFLKKQDGVTLINSSNEYRPFKIDNINLNEFYFFNKDLENNPDEKEKVCAMVGTISYFYFIDKYGVQWELEQANG